MMVDRPDCSDVAPWPFSKCVFLGSRIGSCKRLYVGANYCAYHSANYGAYHSAHYGAYHSANYGAEDRSERFHHFGFLVDFTDYKHDGHNHEFDVVVDDAINGVRRPQTDLRRSQ